MKSIITSLFLFVGTFIFSQGNIVSYTMEPIYPTTNDTIYIYVDMSFTTSSCELDTKNIQVNGTSILANSHHCLGMLQAICNITDTFTILPLQAAVNYNFSLLLTSGFGNIPCTPGIVADDTLSFNFGVSDMSNINDVQLVDFSIFPNPSNGNFTIELPSNYKNDFFVNITNAIGEKVYTNTFNNGISEFELNLESGIYYVSVFAGNNSNKLTKKIVVK